MEQVLVTAIPPSFHASSMLGAPAKSHRSGDCGSAGGMAPVLVNPEVKEQKNRRIG